MAATERGENEYGIICMLPEVVADYQRQLFQKIEHQFNLNGDLSSGAPAHFTMKYRFAAFELFFDNLALLKIDGDGQAIYKEYWLLDSFNG